MRNLIPNFIAEKFLANESSGNFSASTMFLDISGFTPMTERLMKEGKEGAEVLSEIINNIFSPVITEVYSYGGFVASFAGDAFTAIFPSSDNSLLVIACALEIRQIFEKIGKQQTKFGEFELFFKLGLSYGLVEFGIIGNQKQQSYYFRGTAIDNCANSEHYARKSEMIFDFNFYKNIPKNVRTPKVCFYNGFYRLINCEFAPTFNDSIFNKNKKEELPVLTKSVIDKSQIPMEILQKFIPDQVLTLDQQGEFREIVAVFISFKEPDRIEDLNHLILKTIDRCDQYGGYFNQALFGDKGGMMLICFGMPKSYENNLVRALDFSLDLAKEFGDRIRVGLNSGVAYSGFIGSSLIGEYTAYGDIVNQAARFMAKANWGKIWTTENMTQRVAKLYNFNNLGEMQFKGKSDQISIFELVAKVENSESAFFSGEMVGRQAELELLNNFAKPLSESKFAGIITVYAEAGMGKSRLVYEFVKSQVNAEILFLQTDSVLKMSLNPFKYLLHNYFNQNKATNKEEKKANFEAVFDLLLLILNNSTDERKLSIIKELERTKSILAAQVEVFYDNSLYEQLDAKGRFENTLFAYKEFFKALSLFKPVVIQIEDIHWLEDDSQTALKTLCRAIDDFPIMIVATSRFNDDGSKPGLKVDKEVNQSKIILDKLDAESGKYFIELQLEKPAEDDLISFVCNKSEYNPFYIEQIVYYLKENKLLAEKEGKYFLTKQDFAIPNSISAIIIARIDRLESDVKNLLQMASVFGREVELNTFLIMIELYHLKVEQSQLKSMLEKIEDEQLWNKFAEIKYIFKHALLNEAAYEMQLKSRLRDLHKLAAQSLEKLYINEEEKFYEIARHYDKAEEIDLAVNYYEKAGDWLKKNYQNEKAIECYDRVLAFLDDEKDAERVIDALNKKGDVLKLIGEWIQAEKLYGAVLILAKKYNKVNTTISVLNNLARIKSGQGYKSLAMSILDEAMSLSIELCDKKFIAMTTDGIGHIYSDQSDLKKALEYFQNEMYINSEIDDQWGIAKAFGNIGHIYVKRCDYSRAIELFQKQLDICIIIADKSGYANAIGNMGVAYYSLGEYGKSKECYEKQLEIAVSIGDKHSISKAIGNIGNIFLSNGDYKKSIDYYQNKMNIALEIGDKWDLSSSIGNMGLANCNLGHYDKALENYRTELLILEELKDKHSKLCTLGNIGVAYYYKNDLDEALNYYYKQMELATELGDKRILSSVIGNVGIVYKDQKEYFKALECYERAVEIARELNIKYYLCYNLVSLAELQFLLNEYKTAQFINDEALELALEIKDKDAIFSTKVMSHKLLALENPTEAVANLTKMLEAETEEENIATIHYETYKINQSAEHQQKALDFYQQLYEKTPNIEYKNRIDELKTAE